MTPVVGSEWCAGDGRIMRVEEVCPPRTLHGWPRAKLTVLNAGKGMRRQTTLSTQNFGSDRASAFLVPRGPDDC